jgi:hypothetical protein
MARFGSQGEGQGSKLVALHIEGLETPISCDNVNQAIFANRQTARGTLKRHAPENRHIQITVQFANHFNGMHLEGFLRGIRVDDDGIHSEIEFGWNRNLHRTDFTILQFHFRIFAIIDEPPQPNQRVNDFNTQDFLRAAQLCSNVSGCTVSSGKVSGVRVGVSGVNFLGV